ncbi:hypothetical protein [Pseudomonas sp. HS6]|uniref:hypothetical protein n=1 Tax=Pseudomonas sp. HS6 TaxID=2850559 RepID=UPI002019FC60|nr:hypothetical protein [Pseudomonas sp. HS6]UQS16886.1 hypothetical protein JJN09_08545 [Pseudomonas sp. HS6]
MESKSDAHVVAALISIGLNEKDSQWAERACLLLLESERKSIVTAALEALVQLARDHGKLDRNRVMPVLNSVKRRFPSLTSAVAATLDEMAMAA